MEQSVLALVVVVGVLLPPPPLPPPPELPPPPPPLVPDVVKFAMLPVDVPTPFMAVIR